MRFENTHKTVLSQIFHPHHPWSGRRVGVHATIDKPDGVVFRCALDGSEADRWLEIPAWMFDRAGYPHAASMTAADGTWMVRDRDLGRSAAGGVQRVGFERMVAEVCLGKVGAVCAREVSRFARNSRDRRQLIEMCRVVDVLGQQLLEVPAGILAALIRVMK